MRRALFAIAALLAAPAAQAQVVQPQYVRPSKGQSLTLVNQAIWGPSGAITPADSAVLDWTAFAGLSLSFSRPPLITDCKTTLRVRVYGSNAPAGPFGYILDAPASEFDARENGTSWYVPVTAPYIKVAYYVYLAPVGANTCTDVVTLKATPIPFDYAAKPTVNIGASESYNVASTFAFVNNYNGSSTTGTGGRRHLRLQNLGTTAIGCSVDSGGTAGFVLSAGTAVNDGTGGTHELDGFSGFLRCKCMTPACSGVLGTTAW